MKRRAFLLALAAVLPLTVSAQIVQDFAPERGKDPNGLVRHHADDEKLKGQRVEPGRVVFFGDSITAIWKLPTYFAGKPYINRGISSQVTSQMLGRLYPDVIDMKPAAMILLAGTNDIAQNNGPETLDMIEENFMAITELAQAHGIKVILCSVTPIADYGPTKRSDVRPPTDILKVNDWMKDYAARVGVIYADYFSVLVDDTGRMKPGISADGLHPNDQGFALMAPVAQAAIDKALQLKK
jgi:lysophospholipase L1-like esterase